MQWKQSPKVAIFCNTQQWHGCRETRSPYKWCQVSSFWALRRCIVFNSQNKRERTLILSVLNEPFRFSTRGHNIKKRAIHDEDGVLIWEAILIGRRLLLIVVTTFILFLMTKLYPVGVLLVIFAIHDYVTRPYSSAKLNFLQFLSTLILVETRFIGTFLFSLFINKVFLF